MAVRTLKPTSAGRRFQTMLSFDEITKTRPEKSLVVTKKRTGGRNALGRITTRHIGGGHKRKIRLVDFRREKFGVPAQGGGDRVRPEPERPDRAPPLPGRREALHPRAARAQGGRHGGVGPERRHPARQRAAAPRHPGGHDDPQRRAPARQGRAALPERGDRGPARRQGRGDGARQAPLRRDPADPPDAAWRRSGRWGTSTTRTSRSARRAAAAGRGSARRCAARR